MISAEVRKELHIYLDGLNKNAKAITIKDNPTDTEKILGDLASLHEECGEFAAEIRKMVKMTYNQKKADSFQMEDLEEEAVDVLLTLLLMLKGLGIENLDEAIMRKVEKNNKRGY